MSQQFDVVIMGAGMSGLCMAVALKKAGLHNFVLLEKSAGLGGTWWDNRYPGAHVDVPAPLYSFSFAPNPRWQRRFAAAGEIQAYMAGVAQGFGIEPHIQFCQQVLSAHFDSQLGRWTITSQADGQAPSTMQARFFVCSTGPLSQPRWPDISGLHRYTGHLLHSARWDGSVPLAGRRVGVIGTGSTAAQLVAPIAAQAAHLTVFQRTANWVLPRVDRRYGAFDHWLARQPLLSAAVRRGWAGVLEWGRRGFDDNTLARRMLLRAAARHRLRGVPSAALRAQLVPPYALGCKRLIYSNDYYPALSRPNTTLETAAIVEASATGLVTGDGRSHALDVLVCATGFDVQHSLAAVPITGLHGQTLAQAWSAGPQPGPLAHLGLTVAGFPNLFLMLGPNTATGHTSTLLFIEPGARWAVRAMQEVQRRGQRWLAVKPGVMENFNTTLQQRLHGAVWSQCRSWYQADSGRNIAIWPGYSNEYVRAVEGQRFQDFEFG